MGKSPPTGRRGLSLLIQASPPVSGGHVTLGSTSRTERKGLRRPSSSHFSGPTTERPGAAGRQEGARGVGVGGSKRPVRSSSPWRLQDYNQAPRKHNCFHAACRFGDTFLVLSIYLKIFQPGPSSFLSCRLPWPQPVPPSS